MNIDSFATSTTHFLLSFKLVGAASKGHAAAENRSKVGAVVSVSKVGQPLAVGCQGSPLESLELLIWPS